MYEENLRKLQDQNDHLKKQLEEAEELNNEHTQKITTLEEQLKDFQFVSVTSSFSKFTEEYFKQLAYRIHDDLYQRMVSLFEGLNEMQETYNALERHSNLLHDHNRRRNEETRAYDTLVGWKKYIKDRPDDLPVLDKGNLKRIKVSNETWEIVCDLVKSIIRDG